MNVLTIATYQLGHQPFSCLSVCNILEQNGHDTKIFDFEKRDEYEQTLFNELNWADALLIAVPMHTGTRIALEIVTIVQNDLPNLPIGLFGLYASNLNDLDLSPQISLLASGESQAEILHWISNVQNTVTRNHPTRIIVRNNKTAVKEMPLPLDRTKVLPLENYARLEIDGTERLVGYTETTRGCSHKCTHCPVPVVYDGKFRINEINWVLTDIDQLVVLGAKHISFGDPDFFNAPIHAMKILDQMHKRYPHLTFDATIKVEHLLQYARLIPKLAENGCVFLVSAFEHISSKVLEILAKNHSQNDMKLAIELCRKNGIEIRPSLLPFTPWTTPKDIVDLFNFVIEQDIIANVDPVQYSIRLLVPHGSLLLNNKATSSYFSAPSASSPLTYNWTSEYSELEVLQKELTKLAAQATGKESIFETFDQAYKLVCTLFGIDYLSPKYDRSKQSPAKLTEAWFCCAEPTEAMLASPLLQSYTSSVDRITL